MNLFFYVVENKRTCMLMYVEKGEGSGSGNRDFDSHKCFMSFISQKFVYVHVL